MLFVKKFSKKLIGLMVDTGERYVPKGPFDKLDATHTTNYIFAKQFIRDKTVLDAGCGYGYGSEFLARSRARRVVGVDKSNEAVRFSKSHYNIANLDFRVMEVTQLAFKDHSFDVIVSFEVIEHLYDIKKYLSEIKRVLNEDGIFVISTPNKRVTSPGLKNPILPFHVKEFYPEELCSLLKAYFKEVNILGKKIANEEILMKQQQFMESSRFKIISRLSQHESIRALTRLLPLRVKQVLTGSKQQGLKHSDFEISNENVESAHSLMAICRK